MSQNISPRQAMQNNLVPLVCVSIVLVITLIFGRDMWVYLIGDVEYGFLGWMLFLGCILLVFIIGLIIYIKSYKRYIAEKNGPPKPASPVPTASATARTAQRVQNIATNPPVSGSMTSPAPPVPARASLSPSSPRIIEKEKVIIKEIVKVRCSWCGALVDQGLAECPNCAGRL
ncbi:MAG: hypothetical protein Q6365_001660 [Candidatus Sigynarchaeota archaeon]